MSDILQRFDSWLADGGPSALVMKEHLEPAAGRDEPIFPPTFAPPEDAPRGTPANYVIDGEGPASVCLLDSVGSQSNRMEPVFRTDAYKALVPQVTIRAGERPVSLLDAGHRAADAVVRSTELAAELEQCYRSYAAGNAEPLAKIAPTSLVFGSWDSRASGAKAPRLINSTIRAFGVRKLNRAAQYFAALESDEVEPLVGASPAKERKDLSKAGFLDAPSGTTHGGVLVSGDIVRTGIVNLTALRALAAGADAERTRKLQRYILGLTLVAAFLPADLNLRQGCLLVASTEKPATKQLVYRDGRREDCAAGFDEAVEYARATAADFGVGGDRTVDFDPKLAKQVLAKAKKEKSES